MLWLRASPQHMITGVLPMYHVWLTLYRLIPSLMFAFRAGSKLRVRGDGEQGQGSNGEPSMVLTRTTWMCRCCQACSCSHSSRIPMRPSRVDCVPRTLERSSACSTASRLASEVMRCWAVRVLRSITSSSTWLVEAAASLHYGRRQCKVGKKHSA